MFLADSEFGNDNDSKVVLSLVFYCGLCIYKLSETTTE